MKKYLSTAILSFIILGTLQAQHINSKHINLGIKGGLNGYTVTGNNNADYTPRIGFNLGLLAHIHSTSKFALQPEVVYSVQGTKYKSGGTEVDLQLNYVNIPFLFQYMFDNWGF